MFDKTDKMCQQATVIRFFIWRNQKEDSDILFSDTYNDILGLAGSSGSAKMIYSLYHRRLFFTYFPFFMTVAPSEIMITAVRIEL